MPIQHAASACQGKIDEIKVSDKGIIGGGTHLKPEQVHKLVEERKEEVVFFDGRNSFEAKVGKFKGAVVPKTSTTRDFIKEIDSGRYDHLKNKAVITYCTGGIRCEILSVIMKNRGFNEVYQIKGGIVRYGNTIGDDGLWEGALYTFDARMAYDFTAKAKTIGKCEKCGEDTKQFYNCSNKSCRELILLCETCAANAESFACEHDPARQHDKELIG